MARRRGGTQPAPLTQRDVLDAALRVVERGGLDRLTVRAVADELGVTPPAVHYHLRGGEDLADRVVEAVAADIRIELDPAAPWVDQYVGLVTAMDEAFRRYPGTGMRALTASRPSAAAGRLTGTALAILRAAGLAEPAAVELFTATYLLFTGWLAARGLMAAGGTHPSLAAAGMTGPGLDDLSTLERALRRVLATVPAAAPPVADRIDPAGPARPALTEETRP
ncbi:transcriptional regulator, TetR family [Frankia torreyi]|uniref:Transcriptional regulator, TetR family n=1 Tax=Frankia torreyi TaxID=1856 RepID=A0A0D8BCJ3_9ACTN|nr:MULTISPECIES: TetR/AcrR family transcriptional regulator [Frankia]KJE21896.1 transcriptional regulator, TetR family [Frankia torreyi]KQC35847.1 TetR family transcriptional regulator [Frankia sp. ACN1ag]KQM05273.1 transcriptional regulator, TetR family [Frankia sp. CpI1-P]